MIDSQKILPSIIGEKNIYRRHFKKNDGRNLFLYGYEKHVIDPVEEGDLDLAKGGEYRWHPLREEWNIYASHRQNRTFKPSASDDPLAPSFPGKSATEIPFTEFELAVFENRFTSLHFDAPVPNEIDGIEQRPAHGSCEVIVYTPEATGNLHSIGQSKRRLLIEAWNDRYEDLFAAGCEFVLPFENRGDEIGVTLPHPHGQIYGFKQLPPVQQKMCNAFAEGYNLAEEIKNAIPKFGLAEAGGVSAFCPPYARFPLEVWIAPNEIKPGPWAFNAEERDGFAHLLGEVTRRYDEYFQQATPYMLSLHAMPSGGCDDFHFTAQFYPILRAPGRMKYLASVEQSTGIFTVDVMPEQAAQILRDL